MGTLIALICTMDMGTLGTAPLAVTIDEANLTATVTTSKCQLVEASALKFVIHCTARDGTVLTYDIDRSTAMIVAQSHAEGVTLSGHCTRDKRMF